MLFLCSFFSIVNERIKRTRKLYRLKNKKMPMRRGYHPSNPIWVLEASFTKAQDVRVGVLLCRRERHLVLRYVYVRRRILILGWTVTMCPPRPKAKVKKVN